MYHYLEAISSRDGRSMSDVLREAVRDMMAKQPLGDEDGRDRNLKELVAKSS